MRWVCALVRRRSPCDKSNPSPPAVTMPAVDLIFDTDMSIDVDDVGALCVAHALADMGEARILAVVHNSASRYGAAALSVINNYHGRDDIPVGAYNGRVGSHEGTSILSPWSFSRAKWQVGPYVEDLVRKFPSRVRTASDADGNALDVLRRTLSGASPHSVTIVSVGYATNLYDLLHSPGGQELVESKVAKLVMMGGRTGHIEWNFAGAEANGISVCAGADLGCRDDPSYVDAVDGVPTGCRGWRGKRCREGFSDLMESERIERLMQACPQACADGEPVCLPQGGCGPDHNNLGRITNATLALWPPSTPLVFVPFETGVNVYTGSVLQTDGVPEASPCRRAYETFCRENEHWCSESGSRCSWDIQAVVYAVRGTESAYRLQRGHNVVDPATGLNTWTAEGNSYATDDDANQGQTRPEFSLLLRSEMEPAAHMSVEEEISRLMAHTYRPRTPPPMPPPPISPPPSLPPNIPPSPIHPPPLPPPSPSPPLSPPPPRSPPPPPSLPPHPPRPVSPSTSPSPPHAARATSLPLASPQPPVPLQSRSAAGDFVLPSGAAASGTAANTGGRTETIVMDVAILCTLVGGLAALCGLAVLCRGVARMRGSLTTRSAAGQNLEMASGAPAPPTDDPWELNDAAKEAQNTGLDELGPAPGWGARSKTTLVL